NKTRGHGAPPGEYYSSACEDVQNALGLWIENYQLFHRPWAYLHQNLSGRYRVTALSEASTVFDVLKTGSPPSMPDGVYVFFDRPVQIAGMESSVDAVDFFY